MSAPTATAAPLPVVFVEDEARIGHFDLADRLGHGDRRDVSRLVKRNRTELGRYGSIGRRAQMVAIGSGAKRSVTEYLLNEPQAILVSVFAQTPAAADVRQMLIETFMAARRGQLRSARAITVPPVEKPNSGRIMHRKRAFAGAVANLMDAGVDYRDFDHDRVIAFADGLRRVSEAF